MASFIRRLFGGGGSNAPQSSAAKPLTGAAKPPATATKAAAKAEPRTFRKKQKTVHTSSLGISESAKSGMATKTLTGQ